MGGRQAWTDIQITQDFTRAKLNGPVELGNEKLRRWTKTPRNYARIPSTPDRTGGLPRLKGTSWFPCQGGGSFSVNVIGRPSTHSHSAGPSSELPSPCQTVPRQAARSA